MSAGTFACESCGKQYPLKPEYAGRKVKCKCGQVLTVPADAEVDDGTYDIAEPAAPAPQPPKPKPAVNPAPGAAKARVQTAANPSLREGKPSTSSKAAGSQTPLVHAGSRKSAEASSVHDEAGKAKIIKIAIAVGIVMVVVGASIVGLRVLGGDSSGGGAGGGGAVAAVNDHDKVALDLIRSDNMTPMSEWFETGPPGKMLGGYSMKQAQNLYENKWKGELGVTEVFIANMPLSYVVVFQLPTEPEKRAAIYEWQAKFHAEQREKIQTDTGGEYLIIKIPMVKL
jgi:hypothetical protein